MDFDPQRMGSFVPGSGHLCQISSKLVQNCDRESTDRHTHTHRHIHRDHTSDLIICPMLCYSNGTDKKQILRRSLYLTWSWLILYVLPLVTATGMVLSFKVASMLEDTEIIVAP